MTDKLLKACKGKFKEMKLVPSDGGRFEISVNGDLIYSKLKTGQFPDEEKIAAEIAKRAG